MKKYLVEINVINEINGELVYTKIVNTTVEGESKENVLSIISPYNKATIIKNHSNNPLSCSYDFRYYVFRPIHDEPIAAIDVIELID